MTIRPGEEWGHPVARPDDVRRVANDAELAVALAAGTAEVGRGAPIAVAGGDVHRSLGEPRERATMQSVPIDLLEVTADGRSFGAVAHVIVRADWWRGSWWRGPVVAVMNVEQLGDWKVAPRAHPNDGVADVVTVDPAMPVRQRWQAWRRVRQGEHLPHPRLHTSRTASYVVRFEYPLRLWIDGVGQGRVTELAVAVRPDAGRLLV